MYLIAKLLLNSVYGKFGMKDDLATHKIIQIENLDKIIEIKDRITTLELDKDLILISYHDKEEDKLINDYTEYDISVGVASATTSYSRIIMIQLKNLPNNLIYYS
uniref:DNA-directed DNA polymerase n=1 Tax=Paxillus rubicundulus TaxID=463315 RepID=A0A5Q0N2N9_9AGAM|nr:DNA polymerase [Paxillus rubicundulus]QFZ98785.1 DNA polymerase [Paxillus rubicundulus]